ncbi:MAG TPA: DUF2281 domain-containing protein [Anaerolineae bacterium]
MQEVDIALITESLSKLPAEKLVVVYDFVSYLLSRETTRLLRETNSEVYEVMLASENVLRRDWETAEEDRAWADL